jgi:hypothetical protein
MPAYAAEEPGTRIPKTVFVQIPEQADFGCMAGDLQKNMEYNEVIRQTDRVFQILQYAQLFDSVRMGKNTPADVDVVIHAKSLGNQYTDPDQVWVLMTLGVIPYYEKTEAGICFDFAKGGSGEFRFIWPEEAVLGFWAPFVAAFSKEWSLAPDSDEYWRSIRRALIDRFGQEVDIIKSVRNDSGSNEAVENAFWKNEITDVTRHVGPDLVSGRELPVQLPMRARPDTRSGPTCCVTSVK